MPNIQPPEAYSGTPVLHTLSRDTLLYRIHQTRFPAESFNPNPSHQYYGGGRFDSTKDDTYPYLYAGLSAACAIAEALLRDLPNDPAGVGQLPSAKVRGRRISALVTTAEVELVDLRGLLQQRAVAQDNWLPTA